MRPSSRSCNPAPASVLSELIFQPVVVSGGSFSCHIHIHHIHIHMHMHMHIHIPTHLYRYRYGYTCTHPCTFTYHITLCALVTQSPLEVPRVGGLLPWLWSITIIIIIITSSTIIISCISSLITTLSMCCALGGPESPWSSKGGWEPRRPHLRSKRRQRTRLYYDIL